jgi:hypothetical protein
LEVCEWFGLKCGLLSSSEHGEKMRKLQNARKTLDCVRDDSGVSGLFLGRVGRLKISISDGAIKAEFQIEKCRVFDSTYVLNICDLLI